MISVSKFSGNIRRNDATARSCAHAGQAAQWCALAAAHQESNIPVLPAEMSKHIGKDSFKDKMKHLFGLGLSHNLKEQPEVKTTEFIITAERLKEMNAENALSVRMKAMKEVSDLVKTKRLEEHAVEAVWDAVADLLCAEQPVEARHMVLALLRCIIQGQGDRLGILRAIFFRIVRDYAVTEDLLQRVELFKALTDNGKDITYIDDEIGPFAVQWMDETMHSNLARDFLQLLVNIVKFNSSYLDQDKVIQLVQKICHLCNKTSQVGDIEASLKVLDAIVCYSCLPSESLTTFIVTLCHTVKVKELSEACWKLMRNLLGTHLGHSSIRTMCSLMEDRRNHKDAALLLGAVFFVGMALWGAFRLPTLKNSPTSVLPSFRKAMTEDMSEVSFEIVLSLTRLVKKYGKELQVVTWDILLDIMERLVQQTHTFRNPEFVNKVHDQLTAIEELYTRKDFHGCPQRFFGLVEKCSECRPNSSVLLLLSFRAQSIHPARDGWIGELRNLMDKYFRPQLNSTIRKKALEVMFSTLNTHRNLYEDELIEQVLGPQLLHVLEDRDASVRRAACQSLVDIARTCHSSNFSVLLEFIEKIISRELVEHGAIEVPEDGDANESTTEDVEAAVIGLLDILKAKLYSLPARHAALAYDVLVAHLQAHYRLGYNHPAASAIRMQVFDFFFSLQADSSLRLGIVNKRGELRFSVYCLCDSSDVERRLTDKRATGTISPPADSPTLCQSTIPYRFESLPFCKAFNCLLMCLKQERDWKVLKFVLEKLPDSLQNKALLLSSQCSIDQLCSSLCRMVLQVSNRRGGHGASLGPGRDSFPRNDLHLAVLPVLTALPSYHAHLDAAKQREIVVALETGLISRCGRLCVVALTMCIVEMANVMVKMLPSILLKLTHISATVTMASPMLEFLSTLVRIPILYSNFVAEQYISVFAICLPYTNPFKFNQYIVSLAHHVIAMWFIRCRLPFRKDFVQYITKGLRSNALLPFDDTASAHAASNDQSNFRARSTSLNDKPARSLWTAKHLRHPVSAGIPPHDLSAAEVFRTRSISITDPAGHRGQPPLSSLQGGSLEENPSPAPDDALRTVHLELTETCLDMMARYVFSNVSAVPRRSPAAEFLLEGGRSLTWLLGNKLITITTSAGSGNKALFCMDNKDSHSSKNLHNVQSTLPSRGSQEAPGKLESQSGQQLARAERVRQRSVSGGNALRANNDNTLRPLVPFLETSSSSAIPDTGEGPNRMQPTKDQKESPGPYCVPKDQALITDYAPYLTQGWAEVLIRRPTGNTSWMMRLQNFPSPFVDDLAPLPLHDLSTALLHINQDSGLNSDRPAGKGVSVRDVAPCGRGRPTSAVPQRAAIAESKADHFSPFVQDLEEAATFVGPQASVPAAFFPAMEFCSENTSPEPPPLSPRDSLADLSRSSSTSLHGGEQFVQPEEGGMCTESPRPVPSRDRSQEDDEEEDEEQRSLQQQGRVHGLNKSSSSPELSTLRELTKEWEEGAEWPVHKANVPMSISCNPPPSSSELPLPLSREESQANGNQSNSMYRPRGHTISESTTSWRRSVPGYQAQRGANDKVPGGASPSFVFLQLFYSPFFANETNKPILLPKSQVIERAVKVLDRMPPYDTHKIGVIYVGEGQAHSEAAILANEWGSPRYAYFIQALGRLVRLQDCDPEHVFLGGLDTGGEDGRFACCSHDDIMQMMFHVATLMPNKETDKNCSNKKRHICNSYVTVVYNDSHDEYKLGTLTGQFNFVEIIIKPLDYESNLVTIQARKELEGLIDTSVVKIVSDRNLSLLVRQMALHANMASLVHMHRDHHHEEYAFKWLARLRQVKRIRGKVLEELQNRRGQGKPTSSTSPVETGQRTRLISTMDDFSGFV